MKSRFSLLLAAALVLLPFAGRAETSSAADPLANLRAGHPRLFVGEQGFTGMREREKRDPLLAKIVARVRIDAETALREKPIAPGFAGRSLLDAGRESLRRILSCALIYRLETDPRYLRRAREELSALGSLPDWDPGHFLGLAEISLAMAVGYDWLYAELTPEERGAIQTALREKALRFAPVIYAEGGPKDERFWFVHRSSNWNPVCNAGLLAGALALADEEPVLARQIVAGAVRSLPLALAEYEPAGSYPEGPVYWEYGTTYVAIAISLLESSLARDFDLGRSPGFANTAKFYLQITGPTGRAFNYADSTPASGLSPAFTWLAQRFGEPLTQRASRADLERQVERPSRYGFYFALNSFWLPEAPAQKPTAAPLDVHLSGHADLAIFRSAWENQKALFVGLKAGKNGGSHGHLDLGSFVLEADGVRWAVDLGRESYELPGFFGDKRWTYFRVNNFSHNVLSPAQVLQDPAALAPIVAFSSQPSLAFAVADLSAVYPGHFQRYQRGVALLDRKRVLVQDEFEGGKAGEEIAWHFTTEAKVTLAPDGRSARLDQQGQTLHVALLQPASAQFSITSASPPSKAENPNNGSALLTIVLHDSSPSQTVAALFTPASVDHDTPLPTLIPMSRWPSVPPL